MSTQFRPLEIPPGVVATATKKMMSTNYSEVNNVRWVEGQLAPIGGQASYNYAFASPCKAIHGWYGLDNIFRIAYLCETNLYVDIGGTLYDISPINPAIQAYVAGAGGFSDGPFNFGTFSTPRPANISKPLTSLPGAYTLNNFGSIIYAMVSIDGRLLKWDPALGPPGPVVSVAATASWTNATPNITMTANPGTVKPGMVAFDTTNNKYIGVVRTYVGTALVLTINAANASQGSTDTLSFRNIATVQFEDAGRGPVPLGRSFIVTPERFILIFGSFQDGTGGSNGGPRRFAWCDQENPGAWDYANVTSQAGFLDVEPASPIIASAGTRVGNLFWTGRKAYRSRFLGVPYVYNYEELADTCTPWSPQSVVATSAMALWMSQQGVFSFDGTSILPVACRVRPWVDDDIDLIAVRDQACAVHVSNFNEWWWFFPQDGYEYNTRAIIYNYKEGWWSQARMTRSAGVAAAYTTRTIMADRLKAFEHENGFVFNNADLPFAETFDLNITQSARLITIKQMIPDVDTQGLGDPSDIAAAISNIRYSLFFRRSRSIGDAEQQSALRPVRNDGYVDFRVTGRDVRLRIDIAGPAVPPITLGRHLIDAVVRGDR